MSKNRATSGNRSYVQARSSSLLFSARLDNDSFVRANCAQTPPSPLLPSPSLPFQCNLTLMPTSFRGQVGLQIHIPQKLTMAHVGLAAGLLSEEFWRNPRGADHFSSYCKAPGGRPNMNNRGHSCHHTQDNGNGSARSSRSLSGWKGALTDGGSPNTFMAPMLRKHKEHNCVVLRWQRACSPETSVTSALFVSSATGIPPCPMKYHEKKHTMKAVVQLLLRFKSVDGQMDQ